MRARAMAAALCGAAIALQAQASENKPDPKKLINAQVIAEVQDVLSREVVSYALRNFNRVRGDLTPEQILAFDAQWRQERERERKPLIVATLSNPLSTYVKRVQARSVGLYVEIILTDHHGLNVGQSSITSDMWQGDEAKFQKTYELGPGSIFIDEAEWHEETKTWRAQLNLTIEDPANGELLGAATFELNLTELQRRGAQS
ncbi:hypothetical protein RDV64_02475 [Acuticoccus sp. MNP-M23]|uniref:hypothetical protein n=1 Tax=Acuticoccus sp. MNP-M23 TaxID=3072793 RepID=UPI002816947C|nr:hypothetical protein [Acuticoccus sp. MNP-M23]WMS43288.1 hypothetical protein RDV64_02475 [Acuticoccus sp. MNP-M23]